MSVERIMHCIPSSIIFYYSLLLLLFRARRVNYIKTSEVVQLPYPIQMRCVGQHIYFTQRDTWGWYDFFMNPVVSLFYYYYYFTNYLTLVDKRGCYLHWNSRDIIYKKINKRPQQGLHVPLSLNYHELTKPHLYL